MPTRQTPNLRHRWPVPPPDLGVNEGIEEADPIEADPGEEEDEETEMEHPPPRSNLRLLVASLVTTLEGEVEVEAVSVGVLAGGVDRHQDRHIVRSHIFSKILFQVELIHSSAVLSLPLVSQLLRLLTS